MQLAQATRLLWLAFRESVKPPSQMTVTQWADTYRQLPDTSNAPGKYDSGRTPYMRGIMDALSENSPWERVVVQKGSQVGGSEGAHNFIGTTIDVAPAPMLVVYPTITLAKEWSKDKLSPLIDSTPSIRAKVERHSSRRGRNTLLTKRFPGGRLSVAGANVSRTLQSREAAKLIFEEIDEWPASVDGKGDPADIAVKRAATFRRRRKIYYVSTPTVRGQSRIEKARLEGDDRRFYVPCPHCGEYQELVREQIKYEPENVKGAWYECINANCNGRIEEYHKAQMNTLGRWVATRPGDGRTASFFLPSWYSPWMTWGEIMLDYETVKGDPDRYRVWLNHYAAETWEDRTAGAPDAVGILARVARDTPEVPWHVVLPEDVFIITAGADVQDTRIEMEVVGHGPLGETWSLGYFVIPHDPLTQEAWREVDRILLTRYTKASGQDLGVSAACIDSRFRTDAVHTFCRTRRARKVWAIMGVAGRRAMWERRPRVRKGSEWFRVGVDAAKDMVYGRLRVETPGPGYCHFSSNRDGLPADAEYLDGLTSEEKRFKRDKRSGIYVPFWLKPEGARNEPLDCRGYALAALSGLGLLGITVEKESTSRPYAARPGVSRSVSKVASEASPRDPDAGASTGRKTPRRPTDWLSQRLSGRRA